MDYLKRVFYEESPVSIATIVVLGNCQAEVFPKFQKLMKILTAEPEGLFSKVTKTLSAVRSKISNERLESLILLQVPQSRTPWTKN